MPLVPPRPFPGTLSSRRFARNGLIPTGGLLTMSASATNHCAAYRRKELFSFLGNVDTIAAGSAGSTTRWRFHCHVGYDVRRLVFVVGCAQSAVAMSTSTWVQWTATPSGGSANPLDKMFPGTVSTTPGDDPSEFVWLKMEWSISGAGSVGGTALASNTSYEFDLVANEFARPFVGLVYELGDNSIDGTESTMVPKQWDVYGPIYDAHREKLLIAQTRLWQRNARHLWNLSKDVTVWTQTGTTWINPIDSTTAVAASSAGVNLNTVRDRSYTSANVPCRFAVYARMSAGAGNGEVRIHDGTSTIATITTISGATAAWYTTTFNITAGSVKVDFQIRAATAGQTVEVHAMSLYEYET